MARLARREVIDPMKVQVFHTISRCVRGAFLYGDDPVTGKSHEPRRRWIRDRLECLAAVFGIDCLTYAIMSNHIHVVLRGRPDVVATWSDEEVARRWLKLFPVSRGKGSLPAEPAEPAEAEIGVLVNQKKALAERRRRLSDVSWWMRCTTEHIARRANREDGCTGHFWEGRYKCQLLLDQASLLACAAHVDLNPVRAGIANTPKSSPFTGAKDRIDDLAGGKGARRKSPRRWERNRPGPKSGWLSPIEAAESSDNAGPDASDCGRRASRKGFLPLSLDEYLALLEWTGRALRRGKRGGIPDQLSPVLMRIGLEPSDWCDLVEKFSRMFKRVAGTADHLAEEANRRGLHWVQAPGNPLTTAD